MGHSWLAVVNLFILITASIVVNMQGTTSPSHVASSSKESNNNDEHSTSSMYAEETSTESETGIDPENSTPQQVSNLSTESDLQNQTDVENSTETYYYQEPEFLSLPEHDMYLFLYDYSVWINAFPGIILNLLSVVVTITMKPFNPTSLFMLVLAITDFCVVSVRFIYRFHGVNILTDVQCSLYFSVKNATMTLSNFILMVWTLERMIAVRFPLRVQTWCSMRNTKIALTFTGIFAIVISTPYYFSIRTGRNGGCLYTPFIIDHWLLVDNAYYVWIPMVIIWISNIIILYSMQQTKKAHAAMTQNAESIEKRRKEQAQLTIILLSISFSFIIFHVPQIIATAIERRYPDPWVLYDNPKAFIQFFAYTTLAYEFTYLQNNFNFLLYCSTGRKFREHFARLLCYCRTRSRPSIDGITTMTSVSTVSQNV